MIGSIRSKFGAEIYLRILEYATEPDLI